MLSFFHLIHRLIQPKRARTRRITIVESITTCGPQARPLLGIEVARVMGWRHLDARQSPAIASSEDNLVISRAPGYVGGSWDDGLTVRVDDVCDLGNTWDLTQCLRAVMMELHPKNRKPGRTQDHARR